MCVSLGNLASAAAKGVFIVSLKCSWKCHNENVLCLLVNKKFLVIC